MKKRIVLIGLALFLIAGMVLSFAGCKKEAKSPAGRLNRHRQSSSV